MRDLEMPDKESFIKHYGKIDFISCNETLSVVERMILTREMLEETKRDFGETVKVYQASRRH